MSLLSKTSLNHVVVSVISTIILRLNYIQLLLIYSQVVHFVYLITHNIYIYIHSRSSARQAFSLLFAQCVAHCSCIMVSTFLLKLRQLYIPLTTTIYIIWRWFTIRELRGKCSAVGFHFYRVGFHRCFWKFTV